MNISKKIAVMFGILGLAAGTAGTIALQTHAATGTTGTTNPSGHQGRGTPPAAAGTVTAINGNTLTVTDKRSGTVYSVDASSATIEKFSAPAAGSTTRPTPTTVTVSAITVGDNVMVQGTVSGTTITATKITDGQMMGFRMGFGGHPGGPGRGTSGTISAINGTTITLTGKDGKTYTIDAASSSVKKISQTSLNNLAVGDQLMVQGTTSGTTITAKNIIDDAFPKK